MMIIIHRRPGGILLHICQSRLEQVEQSALLKDITQCGQAGFELKTHFGLRVRDANQPITTPPILF